MKDLIDRLEKATGPDRELDADVMRAALEAEVWSYDDNCHIDAQIKNGIWKRKREEHPDFDPSPQVYWRYRHGDQYGKLPRFTGSIDAAVTLVPEGMEWIISNKGQIGAGSRSFAGVYGRPMWGSECDTNAATPAIALCIAALEARDYVERDLTKMERRAMGDSTEYSDKIAGNTRNHNQPVRFDMTTGGYLGITQWDDPDSDKVRDRVLLSPEQVRRLVAWVEGQRI